MAEAALNLLREAETSVKKRHKNLTLSVAVDGSQVTDRACDVALKFVNVKRGDTLNVVHISDRTKEWLPRHLTPAHLKNFYLDNIASARVKAEWICREKEEGQSTCQALTRVSDKLKTDVLVVGSFGRKGEKLDMLGSVSDYSLRESHSSVCIVRSTGNKIDSRQTKYLFTTDGSPAAAVAFAVLVNLLLKPMDIVNVICVTTTDGVNEEQTIRAYQMYMAEKKVPGECYVRCINRCHQSIPDGILEAAHQHDCDMLVMGISGYSRKKLGSVSEELSIRAHCTTLIIKDAREIISNQYRSAGAASLQSHLVLPRE